MENIPKLLLLIVASAVSVAAISFREQPESATVIAGERVKLHCSVNNQADINLYWQNLATTSYISLDRRMNPYGQLSPDQRRRYSIVGNPERGEYNLVINNASKADEGRYACVFFLNFNYYSQVAKLRVVRPPDRGYPKCSVSPINRPNIGDNVTLICESRGGDPPSTLSWVRGTTRLATQRGRLAKGDPVVHYSTILTEDESDVRFTCIANNPALQQPSMCTVTPLRSSLGVILRPVVASVEVGESFTFVCITERMPNLAYQWYINNKPIDGRETRFSYIRGGQRLLIEAVTMEDDYALVKCEVTQKDHGYSGSAVGLLWVQSRSVSTPDVLEPEVTYSAPKVSTKSPLSLKLRTTTLMTTAGTTTELLTTRKSTTAATTTSPPTITATTTTKFPTTTAAQTTTRATVPLTTTQRATTKTLTTASTLATSKAIHTTLANLIKTTKPPSVETDLIVFDYLSSSTGKSKDSSSSTASELSSSYSSVSHLSSEDHEPEAGGTPSQIAIESPTDSRLLDGEIMTTVRLNEGTEDALDTSVYEGETNTIIADQDTTNPANTSSTGVVSNTSNTIDTFVEESFTETTVVDNEILFGGNDNQTSDIDIETGSGDWVNNDAVGEGIDNGGLLPNEAGIGYTLGGSMPNWGLIAGLFVVFIIIVVALSALAVYLYRRRVKTPKAQPST